jgi:hypothetical protein
MWHHTMHPYHETLRIVIEIQNKPRGVGSPVHSTELELPLQPFLGDGETCKLLQTCMCQSSGSTKKGGGI